MIENGDLDHHDNDDTETLIGSQFGKSRSHDKDNINLNNGLPSLQSIGEPNIKLSGMCYAPINVFLQWDSSGITSGMGKPCGRVVRDANL